LEDSPVAPPQPVEEAAAVDELSDGDAAALLTEKLAALDDEYLS
jgi:hypothetical protein